MVSTIQPTTSRPWANAFAHPATEFGSTPLRAISGTIPKGLRGSFYRNGPARFDRGGQRVGHGCDGDGAILAVHFTDTGATGVYRYVQTQEYQTEEQLGILSSAVMVGRPQDQSGNRLGYPSRIVPTLRC